MRGHGKITRVLAHIAHTDGDTVLDNPMNNADAGWQGVAAGGCVEGARDDERDERAITLAQETHFADIEGGEAGGGFEGAFAENLNVQRRAQFAGKEIEG